MSHENCGKMTILTGSTVDQVIDTSVVAPGMGERKRERKSGTALV